MKKSALKARPARRWVLIPVSLCSLRSLLGQHGLARRFAISLFAIGVLGAVGCSSDDAPAELEQPLPTYCNPLTRDHCFLPWPSSFYLKTDASTETGLRLNYTSEVMPVSKYDKVLTPTRYNLRDGFSIGSQPIIWLKGGLSLDGVANIDDPAPSTSADSPIWFLAHPSGERVAFFAELDANAKGQEPQALILRPLQPLKPNTRYIVALKASLKDAAGAPAKAPEGFARLRDGYPTADPTLEAQRERTKEVLDALDKLGLAKGEIVLAWDFHTASHASSTGQLAAMVDEALKKLPTGGPDYTLTTNTQHDDATAEPHLWRELAGTYQVPSFLVDDSDDAKLKLDADGKAVYRGMQAFEFRMHVPRCAMNATKPLPILLFGHGLFGNAHDELKAALHRALADELCMIEVSTTWIGLSSYDVTAVATQVIPDFTNLPRVTDRLQQAHVNQHALVELITGKLLADPTLSYNGKPLADGKEIYYYGISDGAIQGFTFASLQKKIKRFALNVGGGWWSFMIERSADFQLLAVAMALHYPSALDRAILIGSCQSIWDETDPINYAATALKNAPDKRILIQESIGDDEVPNLSNRALIRAAGLQLLEPVIEPVLGIESAAGPLQSAYTQWNVNPSELPPKVNKPAKKLPVDLSAHKVIRHLVDVVEQLRRFYKPDGQIEQTCTGTCECTAGKDCVLMPE